MHRPQQVLSVVTHGVVLLVALAGCPRPDAGSGAPVPDAAVVENGPKLTSAGPRLLSNQTSQPITVLGENLRPGLALKLGVPINVALPLTVVDAHHAYARTEGPLGLGQPESRVEVTLSEGTGSDHIVFVDDIHFPDLVGFAGTADGKTLAAISSTTDMLFLIDVATRKVTPVTTGDGPSALTVVETDMGPRFIVVHQFEPVLLVVDPKTPDQPLRVKAPANASGVVVSGAVAYVAEQARDTVTALTLDGAVKWQTPVDLNPRELMLSPEGLWVGSLQTGNVQLLNRENGLVKQTFAPKPGTPIVGGTTAKFSKYIMNGKAPRDLVYSARSHVALVASIGPNIGPNPEKMEVSMNAGVGVIDPKKGWLRHLGFGAGLTETLLLDEKKNLLFATDVGLGVVRVINVDALAASDAAAGKALLQTLEMPVADGFPHFRVDSQFGDDGHATLSVHSGPRGLALSKDGQTLWVLNRYTGTVGVFDVKAAAKGKAAFVTQFSVVNTQAQQTRRLGQVLYSADYGRTGITCDACHLEGHTEGILFEKTSPLRVYRVPTVRGSRETPPYFTPASTFSMGETMKVVGGRNRFHNGNPTPAEIEALTLFGSLIPTLPNPFVGSDGAPITELTLPDGQKGNPRAGLALFEGKAQCSGCHPSPHFTMDQDLKTRNRSIDVGTPHFLPLREAMQDTRFEGFGTPALAGSWDVFPMMTSGLAGLTVNADESVSVDARFCLRVAVEKWAGKHGRADTLTDQERNDLLAYVMSL